MLKTALKNTNSAQSWVSFNVFCHLHLRRASLDMHCTVVLGSGSVNSIEEKRGFCESLMSQSRAAFKLGVTILHKLFLIQ